MATINWVTTPQYMSAVYNPIVFSVTSTEQTRPDFRYIIRVEDGLGNLIATMTRAGGLSVSDVMTIDISSVLRARHAFDFWRYNVTGSQYIYNIPTYRRQYKVIIYEQYDGATHGQAIFMQGYTYPMSIPTIKYTIISPLVSGQRGRWLTNFTTIRVRATDKVTPSFLASFDGFAFMQYKFYRGDTLLASVKKNNPFLTGGQTVNGWNDVFHVHAGLQEIAAYCGVSNTIRDNTNRYVISGNDLAPIEFQVVESDCRFDGVRTHYLNEWGAIDSFLFSLAARRATTISKKKAKLPFTNNPLRPSAYGLGTSPYLVTFTDTLKLTSDYITDNDSTALLEMFTSPLVSVETEQRLFLPTAAKGNKIIIPADLELTNYDLKQTALDRLFNLELEIKISVDNKRQSL